MNKAITKITQRLIKQYHPEKVVLFGSHATGEVTVDSDIDLFVIKNTKKKFGQRWSEVYRIIRKVHNVPVDIIVYTPEEVKKYLFPGTFVDTVLKDGKLLYEKGENKF